MSMVPMTGVLGTVAKIDSQDPEAARALLQFGLYESMCDQSADAWAEIGPDVIANMADTMIVARKALLRNHVSKTVDARGNSVDLPYAQGLAIIESYVSKGVMGDIVNAIAGMFDPKEHPRGGGGRFVRRQIGVGQENQQPDQKRRSTEIEARGHLQDWEDAGLIKPDTPVVLHHRYVSDHNTPIAGKAGEVNTKATKATLAQDIGSVVDGSLQPITLEGISLDASKIPAQNARQRAAMDIMAHAVGAGDVQGRRLLRGLPMNEATGEVNLQDKNARDWNKPGSPGDRQSFRRMSMTGQLLSNISAPGSTIDTIGGLAQLIGDLGPEAEKVLGPGIRRTAYRYRGTEKRPDKQLRADVDTATAAAESLDWNKHGKEPVKTRDSLAAGRKKITDSATGPGARSNAVTQTDRYWMDADVGHSEDRRTLGMRGDAAVVNLLDALPDKTLTALSVESGELPPSQGVIIDANGHVTSQSVGYNGDHYLPFDLKNLGSLHGGQYVRTRASGGPTTEDIYTGLLSGARQIQVVSNSGVFTVEFDPDLRGGRRYSDKAARMIDRYGKLLSTIATGNLYQDDLTPDQLKQARATALANSGNNLDLYTTNLEAETKRMRMESSIHQDDDISEHEEAAQFKAEAAVVAENKRRKANKFEPLTTTEAGYLMDEERRAELQSKVGPVVRKLRLDGPGYDRALKTLKQEFPFFIRQASWQSLPDYLSSRNLRNTKSFRIHAPVDSGYVKPGATHARRKESWEGETAAVSTTTGSGATGQAAASTPAAAGAPAAASTTLAKVTGPGTPYAKEVGRAISGGLVLLAANPPEGGQFPLSTDSDEEAIQGIDPQNFAHWKLLQFDTKFGRALMPEKFADWLLDPSTSPGMTDRILDAADFAMDQADAGVPGYEVTKVKAANEQLRTLLSLKAPFATTDPNNAEIIFAKPAVDDPKPQKFDGIPEVADDQAYTDYLNNSFATDRLFVDTVREFTDQHVTDGVINKVGAEGMADEVDRTLEAYQNETNPAQSRQLEATLAAQQKAWSFITARHVSNVLTKMGGAAGGAVPLRKGFVRKNGHRRIIVHPANDQFSQQVRKALRSGSRL